MNKQFLGRTLVLLFLLLAVYSSAVYAAESDVVMVIQSENENAFTITASDPVGGGYIGDLSVTVWSAKNGQDDLKTEVLNYADGQYTLTVSDADHHNDKGMYYIELSGPSGLLKTDFTSLAVGANEWVRYSYDDGGKVQAMTIRAALVIDPVIKNNTEEANSGEDFKSGYGYTTTFNTSVISNIEVDAQTTTTGAGNARLYFPEFNYTQGIMTNGSFGQFDRLTDCTSRENLGNIADSILELKTNPFSASENRVHFTPIWYPDDTTYTVYTQVFDAWTPAGMLSTDVNSSFTVNGNVYDDWQINNKRVE